jgi:hypothetical protein
MAGVKLTKRVVEAAEVRPSDYFIWCDELPGFGVRIYPSGKRGYLVQYRADGSGCTVTSPANRPARGRWLCSAKLPAVRIQRRNGQPAVRP